MKIPRNVGIMLCFLLVILIIGGGSLWGKYQNARKISVVKDAPHIEWMHTNFDWGTIGQTQKMNHHFPIRNTGTKPLVISNIRTSCNCITAEILKERISQHLPTSLEPGEKAILSASFDPEKVNSRGLIKHTVQIEMNDPLLPSLPFRLQTYIE